MIVVMKTGAADREGEGVAARVAGPGFRAPASRGEERTAPAAGRSA